MQSEERNTEEELKQVLGFTEFSSSKNKDHKASAVEYFYGPAKRKFRTYQNYRPPRNL